MKQHPELLERLIDTAPLRLIEASTSERWGGARSNQPSTTQGNSKDITNLGIWLPGIGTKRFEKGYGSSYCDYMYY